MVRTILVSDGCGFVGRHLTSRLLKLGFEVTIVDNLSTGIHPKFLISKEFAGKYTFYEMDFRKFVNSLDSKKRFSDIYHQ